MCSGVPGQYRSRQAQGFGAIGNLALQVDIPASTGILREVPGFDGAFNWTRQPQAKDPSTEVDAVPLSTDGLVGEGNPAERTLAGTPGQTESCGIAASDDIFRTDVWMVWEAVRALWKCHNSACRSWHRQEASIPSPGKHGDLVAVVPHAVDGPRHTDEVPARGTVFDAVLVRKDHGRIISRRGASFLAITLPQEKNGWPVRPTFFSPYG